MALLLVSNCKAAQWVTFTVGEYAVASKRVLKHLAVKINNLTQRFNFNRHVDVGCEKAAKAINALARIMSNSYGPSSSKRRLLASVSLSLLRYGSPTWISAFWTIQNLATLNSTFRLMTMRVASAYRTVWQYASSQECSLLVSQWSKT
ncbi:uncharacterized protein LOC128746214 [Sabethes cyaneus]|uniref:uncharacterized protein LOC128746214 n=1 Tax=Sabethes cyaneus TaxID=53552 RepID=UPI00237DF84F|nr:uncharacterized protein LOC128746214 [Sabethes cyaneus]